MMVSDTHKVDNVRFGRISKLLLMLKSIICMLLFMEFLVFCGLYIFFSVVYRFILTPQQQDLFDGIVLYCGQFPNTSYIPGLSLLGLYVVAFNRWWGQYTSLPLPNNLMMSLRENIHGADESRRLLRRTLMRYANLSSVLILRSISTRVHKRFPTLKHIVEAGLMTTHELKEFESCHSDFNKYWIPLTWFSDLASRAREEGQIRDDIAYRRLMDEANNYRAKCSHLLHSNRISIPLAFAQIVKLAGYCFFGNCIISRQFLNAEKGYDNHKIDMYVPVFTLMEFFFYSVLLKVWELMINPFGGDDDYFKINTLIDQNNEMSMLAVDNMYQNSTQIASLMDVTSLQHGEDDDNDSPEVRMNGTNSKELGSLLVEVTVNNN